MPISDSNNKNKIISSRRGDRPFLHVETEASRNKDCIQFYKMYVNLKNGTDLSYVFYAVKNKEKWDKKLLNYKSLNNQMLSYFQVLPERKTNTHLYVKNNLLSAIFASLMCWFSRIISTCFINTDICTKKISNFGVVCLFVFPWKIHIRKMEF